MSGTFVQAGPESQSVSVCLSVLLMLLMHAYDAYA